MELNFPKISGTTVGLTYLRSKCWASIYLWIAGVVMPVIYIFVHHKAGLYANSGTSIYYLIAVIYGRFLWMWGYRKKRGQLTTTDALTDGISEGFPIVYTPGKCHLPLFLVSVVPFLDTIWISTVYTDSNVPWLDSSTTALSIVGTWILVHKYVEQWFAWVLVDIVCCGLYIYKDLYFTSALYGLYSTIVVFGYPKWKESVNIQ